MVTTMKNACSYVRARTCSLPSLRRAANFTSDNRLDTINHCLWRDHDRAPLTPKAFDVLRYLIEHAASSPQDDLLEALWPETYVNPGEIQSTSWKSGECWTIGYGTLLPSPIIENVASSLVYRSFRATARSSPLEIDIA